MIYIPRMRIHISLISVEFDQELNKLECWFFLCKSLPLFDVVKLYERDLNLTVIGICKENARKLFPYEQAVGEKSFPSVHCAKWFSKNTVLIYDCSP